MRDVETVLRRKIRYDTENNAFVISEPPSITYEIQENENKDRKIQREYG